MTYEETAKALRLCGSDDELPCKKCPRLSRCKEEHNMHGLFDDAASAIEELSKRVPKVPHGRLIDADDVNNHIHGWVDLRGCPTIIPAEEAATKDIDVPSKPYDLVYEEGGLGIR